MISILSLNLSILKKISPTSNESDTILWNIVLPSNSLTSRDALRHTSLKAVFTRSILAKGEGMDVISFLALAPSGSSMVSRALELYGKAGFSFQPWKVVVPSLYNLNTFDMMITH